MYDKDGKQPIFGGPEFAETRLRFNGPVELAVPYVRVARQFLANAKENKHYGALDQRVQRTTLPNGVEVYVESIMGQDVMTIDVTKLVPPEKEEPCVYTMESGFVRHGYAASYEFIPKDLSKLNGEYFSSQWTETGYSTQKNLEAQLYPDKKPSMDTPVWDNFESWTLPVDKDKAWDTDYVSALHMKNRLISGGQSNPGNFSGLMRTLLRAKLGLPVKDFQECELGVYDDGYSVLPTLSGHLLLNGSNLTTGIVLDKENYCYWLIEIRRAVTATRIFLDECGQLLLDYRILDPSLSVDERHILDAFALAYATLEDSDAAAAAKIHTFDDNFDGWSLYYGWCFNYEGSEAAIVTHKPLSIKTPDTPPGEETSDPACWKTRQYRMEFSFSKNNPPSVSVSTTSGPHKWFPWLCNSAVWWPSGAGESVTAIPPIYGAQTWWQEEGGPFPVHCFYDKDDHLLTATWELRTVAIQGISDYSNWYNCMACCGNEKWFMTSPATTKRTLTIRLEGSSYASSFMEAVTYNASVTKETQTYVCEGGGGTSAKFCCTGDCLAQIEYDCDTCKGTSKQIQSASTHDCGCAGTYQVRKTVGGIDNEKLVGMIPVSNCTAFFLGKKTMNFTPYPKAWVNMYWDPLGIVGTTWYNTTIVYPGGVRDCVLQDVIFHLDGGGGIAGRCPPCTTPNSYYTGDMHDWEIEFKVVDQWRTHDFKSISDQCTSDCSTAPYKYGSWMEQLFCPAIWGDLGPFFGWTPTVDQGWFGETRYVWYYSEKPEHVRGFPEGTSGIFGWN